ncbi:beta-lactamase family protein [Candidatus Acetothermia bacterium]|jgi:CubicO group peptidase (beta-lactamase class C family)|nr:beta-lactamase family protein [Candidatus Acetothermia bacterium]MCI2427908.1 beta-lactamase family protein [Candidatus Acetothermia bacterium]MCI2428909.1 beta-lactamase family protein [Candidatus Acetothermia bacterium]
MSFAKLEEFIFTKMSETKLPGLSAAVIKGDEVIWKKGFGFRNLECGFPATPSTLYRIGSVTKSFTALSIMQLVEQGKLRLDDPVANYAPVNIKPGGENIRISHLLSHSSGIPALAYSEAMIRGATGAGENWFPIADYSDILTFMADAQDWTLNRPGERWFYSNEGYAILGYIIEKSSGMPYAEYVYKHILAPLGMEQSFFGKEELKKNPDAATPYIITRDGERKPSDYFYSRILSVGALISNVMDLAKYVAMYLGRGKYNRIAPLCSHQSQWRRWRARKLRCLITAPLGREDMATACRSSLTSWATHLLVMEDQYWSPPRTSPLFQNAVWVSPYLPMEAAMLSRNSECTDWRSS